MADPDPTPDPTPDPAPDPTPDPTPDPEPDPIGDKPISADDDWQTKARKHERDLKKERTDRKALADRLKVIEDKDKTDAQRLAEAKDTATKDAADSKAEVLRLRAAIKYGLDEEDLDLLGTGDEDQIEARAKRLSERSGKTEDEPARRPRERLRTGAQPTSEPNKNDPASLAAEVPRGW